jgi:hypothetical protein
MEICRFVVEIARIDGKLNCDFSQCTFNSNLLIQTRSLKDGWQKSSICKHSRGVLVTSQCRNQLKLNAI